jgi:hypothetical protein
MNAGSSSITTTMAVPPGVCTPGGTAAEHNLQFMTQTPTIPGTDVQPDSKPALVCPFACKRQYGYYSKTAVPKGQDLASYINAQVNRPSSTDSKQQPPIAIQRDAPSYLLLMGWMNDGLIPSIPEKAGEKTRFELAEDGRGVKFTLTPQVQQIIGFIRGHAVFFDGTGKHQPKGLLTAQEAFVLVNRIENGGLDVRLLAAVLPRD